MIKQIAIIMVVVGFYTSAMAGEGMLVFKTDPKDVEVHVDGAFKGKANEVMTLNVSEGNHKVKISKDGKTIEKEYFVPADGVVKVELALEGTQKKGKLAFNFIRIEPGSFEMGSNNGESDEKPVHTVTITQPFEISDHEVTVGEYRKFIESTGYQSPPNDCNFHKTGFEDHPVNCVSWDDAQAFISWLNLQAGKSIYRLPTEAEWEYAARAGTKTAWACGDSEWCLTQMGWFKTNSGGQTHPVKTKTPNYWKLYDMHGNVWEWCQDWYGAYPSGSVTNPVDASSGSSRVLRGGSWFNSAANCRSADRLGGTPDGRFDDFGFRLVRSAGQQ
ncbi:MAG: SUMF1/EgtB/PvdO family nonheme iron enzyme [Desulfamplus sp.]|nr:SUMF1/EgtB/PvdO family nonheme iron enzyme [Desulfamplus sp.]